MPGFSVVLYGSAYFASRSCGAWACCTGGFIAHSLVQVSWKRTTSVRMYCFVKHKRPAADATWLDTLVEFTAHSFVHTSLNNTTPVSRYSFVRHDGVAGSTTRRETLRAASLEGALTGA